MCMFVLYIYIYVCMCVCMYSGLLHAHICMYNAAVADMDMLQQMMLAVGTHYLQVCMYVCMYAYVYLFVLCVCITCVYIQMHGER